MIDEAQTAPQAPINSAPPTEQHEPAPPIWESFIDPALKDWAAAEKLHTADDLAARVKEVEPFSGADPESLAVLPPADDPNAVSAFLRERLGAPEDPAAYGLDKLDGIDPDAASAAATWFSQAAMLPHQAEIFAREKLAFDRAQAERLSHEDKAAAQVEDGQLRGEWRGDYEAKHTLATRSLRAALHAAGVDPDATVDFIKGGSGYAAAFKLAELFGGLLRESDFIPDAQPAQTGHPSSLSSQESSLARRLYKDV